MGNGSGPGSLIYRQQVSVFCAKSPQNYGAPLMNYDFKIDPPENVQNTTYNNDSSGRYSLAANQTVVFGMETVAVGSVLIIQPDNNILVQIQSQFAITGNTNSSTSLTSVSSMVGLQIGQAITGAGIQAGTTIVGLAAGVITLSQAATATATGVALQVVGATQSIQINGGQSSIFNMQFLGVTLINPSTSAVATGKIFVAGV